MTTEDPGRQERSLNSLSGEVGKLTGEISHLRTDIKVSVRRKRLSLVAIIFTIWLAATVQDASTIGCGPGHQAEDVVKAVLRGGTHAQVLVAIAKANDVSNPACDVAFPFRGPHGPGQHWPDKANDVGMAAYLLAAYGLSKYVRNGEPT